MPVIDAFLEIIDSSGNAIAGESLDSKHKNLLQIRDFSFGVTMKASVETGTGLGAGKCEMKEFEFTVSNSKASPTLLEYCCNGDHCQKATLYIRKATGKQDDYYIWTFKELIITNFGLSCSEDIGEKINFAYTAIACEYKQQKQDGSLMAGVKAGWDAKENQPFTA